MTVDQPDPARAAARRPAGAVAPAAGDAADRPPPNKVATGGADDDRCSGCGCRRHDHRGDDLHDRRRRLPVRHRPALRRPVRRAARRQQHRPPRRRSCPGRRSTIPAGATTTRRRRPTATRQPPHDQRRRPQRPRRRRRRRSPQPIAPPKLDIAPTGNAQIDAVLAFAKAQLGKPYVFAAAGPDAYDCSGLTAAAYAQVGVQADPPERHAVHAGHRRRLPQHADPARRPRVHRRLGDAGGHQPRRHRDQRAPSGSRPPGRAPGSASGRSRPRRRSSPCAATLIG